MSTPPTTNATNAPKLAWQDWQAGLAVFIILFLISETDIAPVAEVVAWGVPSLYILNMFARGGKGFDFASIANATHT